MLSFFHKYGMEEKYDVEFIKTDKDGDILETIKKEHRHGIIFVNSQSEGNIYIGSERITDNYNLGVDENSITNNVGGMTSGINASELKGKSVSEILDIILFASNNNMTLKGVQVVDKIENLTDSTLEDVYQGMVVSVVEDNSLYILLTDDSDGREWKKVGSDIDVEELKTSTRKLSAPITVAGLSGSFGNVSNGKVYTTDNTVEDILRDLLCKEIYPSVSLTTNNPTLSFGGLKNASASNHQSLMEVGSVLSLNPVTVEIASISNGSRRGSGFTYGYSVDNDGEKDGDNNPPLISATNVSLVGSYSLTETYSPSSIGTVRTVAASDNCDNVKFDEGSVKIGLGSNTISISATSPSGTYTHPEYPEYFVISNLGNTDVNKKLSKASAVNGSLSSITKSASISVTGVYPVYVNISSDSFVDEPIKMSLTTSNIFELDVPSEVASEKHFTFDYPATHTISSFEIKDLSGNFVEYSATYEAESAIVTKVIGGDDVSYKRLITTGAFQGVGTYKITLSKGLDR